MKTISSVVQEILERSPFLAEVIHEGIGNSAEMARRIRPAVEEELMEKVSEGAIAMALHRLSKDMKRPHYGARLVKKMTDLTVRSNLVSFGFLNTPEALDALYSISKRASGESNAFFNASRGLREVLVIVSEDLAEGIAEALVHIHHVEKVIGLSAISVHLSKESLGVPGVYYPILKAIAMEGINLVEVVSVRTEFTMIFNDKDVDRAFSVLKRVTS